MAFKLGFKKKHQSSGPSKLSSSTSSEMLSSRLQRPAPVGSTDRETAPGAGPSNVGPPYVYQPQPSSSDGREQHSRGNAHPPRSPQPRAAPQSPSRGGISQQSSHSPKKDSRKAHNANGSGNSDQHMSSPILPPGSDFKGSTPATQPSSSGSQSASQTAQTSSTTQSSSHRHHPAYPWSQKRYNGSVLPFPLSGHSTNPVAGKNGEVFIFGGINATSNTVTNELWFVDAESLTTSLLKTTGEIIAPRFGHASVLIGSAFVIFGGDTRTKDSPTMDNNIYFLSTSSLKWSRINVLGQRPSGRFGHSMNTIGSRVYVFGGEVDGYFFNDVLCFDMKAIQTGNPRWHIIPTSDDVAPPPRKNHSMVTFQEKLYLGSFGGTDGKKLYNDTWVFDPLVATWTKLDTCGLKPQPVEKHSAAQAGGVMYVFGGNLADGTELKGLTALRLSGNRWFTFQNMGPAPSSRVGHAMSVYGPKVLVLGGKHSVPHDGHLDLSYVLDVSRIKYPPENPSSQKTSSSEDRGRSLPHAPSQRSQLPHQQLPSPPAGHSSIPPSQSLPHMHQLTQKGSDRKLQSKSSTMSLTNGIGSMGSNANRSREDAHLSTSTAGARSSASGETLEKIEQMNNAKLDDANEANEANDHLESLDQRVERQSSRDGHPTREVKYLLNRFSQSKKVSPIDQRENFESMIPRSDSMSASAAGSSPASTFAPLVPVTSASAPSPITSSVPVSTLSSAGPASSLATTPTLTSVSLREQAMNSFPAPATSMPFQSPGLTERMLPPVNDTSNRSSIRSSIRSVTNSAAVSEAALLRTELEQLRIANKWYESELLVARRAGYVSSMIPAKISASELTKLPSDRNRLSVELKSRKTDSASMLQALIGMKAEIDQVKKNLTVQTKTATASIAEMEQEKERAVQELMYFKAKLELSDKDLKSVDASRINDLEQKLADSIREIDDLRVELRAKESDLDVERTARVLAETELREMHNKVGIIEKAQLDAHKDDLKTEVARLNAQVCDLTSLKVQLQEQATVATERARRAEEQNGLADVKDDILAVVSQVKLNLVESSERVTDLTQQLEDVREKFESSEVENNVLRHSLQETKDMLERAEQKMTEMKGMNDQLMRESTDANESIILGLERVLQAKALRPASVEIKRSRESGSADSGDESLETVAGLKRQLVNVTELYDTNKVALQNTHTQLLNAMAVVTSLQQSRMEILKASDASQNRLNSVVAELRQLRQENTTTREELILKQRDLEAMSVKYNALQKLMSESKNGARVSEELIRDTKFMDLETRLMASIKTQEDMKQFADAQLRQAERTYNEQLDQIKKDYQSAMEHISVVEDIQLILKNEAATYKDQNAKLLKELEVLNTRTVQMKDAYSKRTSDLEGRLRDRDSEIVRIKSLHRNSTATDVLSLVAAST
ncbi:uncharacterized protein V1510DRAFT_405747 [Dipodascopsis tothii]|uniref:uncharacterized protein n=1 Tax=Dipodascopsis tothii TaxID=44089 RepID=UPI0034CF5808